MKKDAERARRFELHLSVRYRSVGATRWHEGRIENISRSGMLFWTEELLRIDTPLEMSFVLPVGKSAPAVLCRGRIVRTLSPKGRRAPAGLAATISNYRFIRGRVAAANA